MDAYIYDADIYCDGCAEDIMARLDREGQEDTGDSGDYPQGPHGDGGGEADGPQICGGGAECVNAESFGGRKIGAFLENPLTEEGVKYLCEMVSRRREQDSFKRALHRRWLNYYRKNGYANQIASCIREEVRERL